MSHLFRLILVLFTACFVAAGSLALVNLVTSKPIAEHAIREKTKAMQAVQPAATEFREIVKDQAWEALKDGQVIGRVINTEIQGYGGPIKLLYGIDTDNKITEVKVLAQTETPGLGARIIDPAFIGQYASQDAATVDLKKSGGGARSQALAGSLYIFPAAEPAVNTPGVDAITGATISSRAVTNGIRQGMAVLEKAGAAGAGKGDAQ